jgi:hypothetical protein
MDRETKPVAVTRLDAGPAAGFFIADTTVLFQRDGRRTAVPVAFRSAGGRFLVADLKEGSWQITRGGRPVGSARVTATEGVLWSAGPAGDYRLELTSR